LDTWDRLV